MLTFGRKLNVETLEQKFEYVTVMYLSQFAHPDVLPTSCNGYSSAARSAVLVREACVSTWYCGGGCAYITRVDLTLCAQLKPKHQVLLLRRRCQILNKRQPAMMAFISCIYQLILQKLSISKQVSYTRYIEGVSYTSILRIIQG